MRRWIGLAAALLVALLMIAIIAVIVRGALSLLNAVDDPGTPDAMFDPYASETAPTRPPELGEEETFAPAEDMSGAWTYEELNPVEKTADDLAREELGE